MSRSVAVTEPIERRTLADGTVQHLCQNARCYNGKWFEPARSDARFCSGACRLQNWRDVKAERERQEAREAAERAQARRVAAHRDKWMSFLRSHLPENSRPTDAVLGRLYTSLVEERMIDAPWSQPTIW